MWCMVCFVGWLNLLILQLNFPPSFHIFHKLTLQFLKNLCRLTQNSYFKDIKVCVWCAELNFQWWETTNKQRKINKFMKILYFHFRTAGRASSLLFNGISIFFFHFFNFFFVGNAFYLFFFSLACFPSLFLFYFILSINTSSVVCI